MDDTEEAFARPFDKAGSAFLKTPNFIIQHIKAFRAALREGRFGSSSNAQLHYTTHQSFRAVL
ncbi:MAG: hypothetical protein DRR08_31530 [Candidatus Parabeggiatoa sp. nov. 2]|nr:MAG: hypothetical protein B6247_08590 [Beggiatoa sp. 4572_84]RKZ48682.1 MAG: hypothetical protein DRR08_31530 [Gammaproteobacteria bacterium]